MFADNHDNHDGYDAENCNWYFGVPFRSKRKEAEMAAPQRKFKVGDRVRFTEAVTREGWWFKGCVGTVSSANGSGYKYSVSVDNSDDDIPAFVDDEHIRHILPRGTRIKLLRDHGVYKAGHRGTVTYENDENVGALMDIGRYAAFPHDVVGVTDDTAPYRAGRKEERGDAEVARQLLEVSWPELRIEPQPKFKAGDRVVTSGADGEPGIGVVLRANCDGTYQVRFAAPYNECREAGEELSLIADEYVPPYPCIVALINKDGKPRPSQWPHVHQDSASAIAEAERLARNNPGTEFAVYQRVAGRVASVEMKEVA